MHIHTIQLNIEKLIGGTVHMDAVEFGAYMSLIVACYQSNNCLPDDDKKLARIARCSTKVWNRIKPVISEKFTKVDGCWSHLVVQRELERCTTLSTKNKANALKRYNSDLPVALRSHCQTSANTKNKEQVTKNKKQNSIVVQKPDCVSDEVWNDFLAHRKRKKAALTGTALKRITSEANKAGWTIEMALEECLARGWTGFKAEWVNKGKVNERTNKTKDELREWVESGR